VGQSYVLIDFVILETGGDERAPIILGQPFLSTVKAIIYADTAKICFTFKDKKENSRSRTVYYILPLIHRRHTYPQRQQQ
jgi:hypothetical protein